MNVLIIGGSGGIGSALVRSYLKRGDAEQVFATYYRHKPKLSDPRLQWFELDVSDEAALAQLAATLPSLDILINAVGILHDAAHLPEKSLAQLDVAFFNKNIQLNTTATILVAKYFCRHLKKSQRSHFISFSARIGSISDNKRGGWISYRCSKAALNMALKTISIEWRYKNPACCVLAFHPGTTDTPFSAPFQKNLPATQLLTPDYVAERLLVLIDNTSAADTGRFYSYQGTTIEW